MSVAEIDRAPAAAARVRPGRGPIAGLVALVVLAVLFLVPVYVLVMAGLKSGAQADARFMWQLPSPIDLGGFGEAWTRLSPNLRNSLLLVIPATILSSVVGALNGFVFAKLPFRGHNVVFAAVMLGMFIPYQVVLIPMVRFLQSVGLYGSLTGLILVHVVYGIPITTLIFRNYFSQLPDEIIEAGQIDGASTWTIFTRLILPLSLPGFVVCGVYQFTNIWNDFLFGIVVVPDPASQPVTVALNNLSGSFSVQWNTVMSGALIAALPTVIVYVLLGRFFVRGFLSGSVK
ncbi:carbohydrate ABC transporter permease [Pseudonocardia alni]|uniref:carbohydrate ABC transporter permease n=1 Tax=Pseudonocardia alni TaxID=33907 RepID=UPI00340AD1C5